MICNGTPNGIVELPQTNDPTIIHSGKKKEKVKSLSRVVLHYVAILTCPLPSTRVFLLTYQVYKGPQFLLPTVFTTKYSTLFKIGRRDSSIIPLTHSLAIAFTSYFFRPQLWSSVDISNSPQREVFHATLPVSLHSHTQVEPACMRGREESSRFHSSILCFRLAPRGKTLPS